MDGEVVMKTSWRKRQYDPACWDSSRSARLVASRGCPILPFVLQHPHTLQPTSSRAIYRLGHLLLEQTEAPARAVAAWKDVGSNTWRFLSTKDVTSLGGSAAFPASVPAEVLPTHEDPDAFFSPVIDGLR